MKFTHIVLRLKVYPSRSGLLCTKLQLSVSLKVMKIDCHVHLFCLSKESGGRTRLGLLGDMARPIVARTLDIHHAKGDKDRESCYVDRLVEQVNTSELDRVVLLSFDKIYAKDGTVFEKKTRFHVPNRYTKQAVDRHPGVFLFGASVHPYRQDAVDALHRVKAEGAVLIKLLPNTHNFDPADNALVPYYRALADLHLPLLVHGGYEHTIPVSNQQFGDPARFRLPLDTGVTVIIAHGGSAGRFHLRETFGAALQLISTYPNCFGDTAALCNYWRSHYLSALKSPDLLERKYGVRMADPFKKFVHGSDFPIPIHPRFFGAGAARRLKDNPGVKSNRLQADIALKRILDIPESCLTRAFEKIGIGR